MVGESGVNTADKLIGSIGDLKTIYNPILILVRNAIQGSGILPKSPLLT